MYSKIVSNQNHISRANRQTGKISTVTIKGTMSFKLASDDEVSPQKITLANPHAMLMKSMHTLK